VQYIADSEGFRVAGTNLPVHVALPPVDTPEVAAAKTQHALLYSQAVAEAALQPAEEEEESADNSAVVEEVAEPEVAAVAQPLPVVNTLEPYYGAAAPYNGAVAAPVIPYAAPVIPYAGPVIPNAAPVITNAAPVIPYAASVSGSQYHAQDELGQYNYGYSDSNSVKQEIKTADGVVRGSYSYVDSDGLVQTVNYIADALGFRVGATNLPVHVVPGADASVAAAAAAADQPVVAAYNTAPVLAPQVSYAYLPYASSYSYNIPVEAAQPYVAAGQPLTVAAAEPVAAAPAPAVAAAPYAVASVPNDVSSQFHAQDELGQYNYGYASSTQTKTEVKTADGVVRGAYSYVDPNGLVQTVNYISDAMGFRVAATNLPVHVVEGSAEAPAAVAATQQVAATNTLLTPQVPYAYLPYAQSYAYNMPAAITA
jgi:uncharacterized protein affecting Mg2+/Co2+ transport